MNYQNYENVNFQIMQGKELVHSFVLHELAGMKFIMMI